jgi:hypothetical protein
LSKPIQGFHEVANFSFLTWNHKSFLLCHGDLLLEVSIEECNIYAKMKHLPLFVCNQCYYWLNHTPLDHKCELFFKIYAFTLFISIGNNASFKFFRFSIKVGLYLKNPFCTNGSFTFWKINKLPSFILLYGVKLNFPSLNPTGTFYSFIKVLVFFDYGE